MTGRFWPFSIAYLIGGLAVVSLTSTVPAQAAYESFRLSPGFRPDPAVGTGLSGGSRSTSCGYVDTAAAPDHVLTLEEDFEYLRVSVEAAGDVSLLLEGPGGTLCADDDVGFLPQIEGFWPEGVYRLWIGDDHRESYTYTLRISQQPSDRDDDATQAERTLEPGFSPAPLRLRGASGGDRSTDCGYVKRNGAPNHVIELTESFEYLRASVDAPGDVTLLIEGPGGTICADDDVGVLPVVEGYWPAGRYQFWIGDFNRAGYEYELTLSESPLDGEDDHSSNAQRLDFGNLPSIGNFTLIRNTYYDSDPIRQFDAEIDGQRQRWWVNCDTDALGTGERTAPSSRQARTVAEFVCED